MIPIQCTVYIDNINVIKKISINIIEYKIQFIQFGLPQLKVLKCETFLLLSCVNNIVSKMHMNSKDRVNW